MSSLLHFNDLMFLIVGNNCCIKKHYGACRFLLETDMLARNIVMHSVLFVLSYLGQDGIRQQLIECLNTINRSRAKLEVVRI